MAITKWNPSNPSVAGIEYPAAELFTINPVPTVSANGPTLTARVTETIDTITPLVRGASGTVPKFVCDVYPAASVQATETWVLAKPVVNLTNGPDWQKWDATNGFSAYSSQAYQFVDDIVAANTSTTTGVLDQLKYSGVDPASPSRIMFKANSSGGLYDGVTGTSGQTLTSKRCRWIEIIAVVINETGHSVRLDGYLQEGSSVQSSQTGPKIIAPNSVAPQRVGFGFYVNPFAAGMPWNQADVVNFTNSTHAFGIGVTTKSGAGDFDVTALMLEFHVCTETRLATGFGIGSATQDKWIPCPLVSPADHSTLQNWSKVNGSQYVVLFTPYDGNLLMSGISSANVFGHEADELTGSNYAGTFLGPGLVPLDARGFVDPPGQVACLFEHSGAASVDSNPYASVTITSLGADGVTAANQIITSESAQAYGIITVLAGLTSDAAGGAVQNAPMTISLKRTSDNATLLGPISIATTDIPADGKYHVIQVRDTAATLTAAQSVYIQCASTSTVGWKLPTLYTRYGNLSASDAKVLLANAATQGGSASNALADTGADFPSWSIGIVPTAPTGLAASAATMTPTRRPGCAPATIGYAHITWNVTTLGAAFGWYELQRFHQTTGWSTIAIVTSESAHAFNDIELQRNTSQSYRIRVVRSDLNYSDWAS